MFVGRELTTYDKGREMGDYMLTIQTAIYEALKKEKDVEKALLLALEDVKKEYPMVTMDVIRGEYEDTMYF